MAKFKTCLVKEYKEQQAFQESIAASELHFEEQALRFVHRR